MVYVLLVPSHTDTHLWFSGKIGHCHCLAPGSIPGECNFLRLLSARTLELMIRRRRSLLSTDLLYPVYKVHGYYQ